MLDLPLRPYQQAAVDAFKARPDKRLILAHAVGAGKTLTAIACAEAIGAKRILVVAPALARLVWVNEFAKWTGKKAHPIRHGRNVKSLSRADEVKRHNAFHADIQVVSYTMMKDIRAVERDIVIFDEVHALRHHSSKQSRLAKAYLRAFPKTPALALSATPIPTEIGNVWNVVDTLFPSALGPPSPRGGISYAFSHLYMKKEVTEYGTRFYGARTDAMQRLARTLNPYMHRATEADFAQYLPPLVTSLIWRDEEHKDMITLVEQWVSQLVLSEKSHLGVFCYFKDSAASYAAWLRGRAWLDGYKIFFVNGDMSPEERAKVLAKAEAESFSLVIATCECVREAISLSFIKDALIVEWRSSPAQATQFLGRFARADSRNQGITRVTYAAEVNDEERAQKLQERLTAIASLMKIDAKSEVLQTLFTPQPVTEERLEALFERSFATFKAGALDSWEEKATH